ncbi:COG3588 Fructose-1,6-bisphosphate aldolase [Candidatus Pelagibacterales bacterium]
MNSIESIALAMVQKGKGILASDESNSTMTKRLESVKIPSTEANRLNFRETLFTSKKIKDFISGIILFDETIKQTASNGKTISKILSDQGIIPGIKVDKGVKPLALSNDEKITEGLDGLKERLNEYYKLGARFTKWRAVYGISNINPSKTSIVANAHALARYAAIVQETNMVPIVEPEVLMDGNHDIKKCYDVTAAVLNECFNQLAIHKVNLKGIVLKPNMILNGSESGKKNITGEVAEKTLDCLKRNVPQEVPGIAFLSGGQSEVEATENLNSINKINDTKFIFTFSYGRALQQSALKTWAKNINDKVTVQDVFDQRSEMNSLASIGKWKLDLEKKAA